MNSPNFEGRDVKTTLRTLSISFTLSDLKRTGTSSIKYLAVLTQLSCLQLCRKFHDISLINIIVMSCSRFEMTEPINHMQGRRMYQSHVPHDSSTIEAYAGVKQIHSLIHVSSNQIHSLIILIFSSSVPRLFSQEDQQFHA